MARSRLEFHDVLLAITDHVYAQAPSNINMQYPCIIYRRSGEDAPHANNRLYQHKMQYEVTVIDRVLDGELWMKVRELPYCSFDRHFTADELNHDVFTVFF